MRKRIFQGRGAAVLASAALAGALIVAAGCSRGGASAAMASSASSSGGSDSGARVGSGGGDAQGPAQTIPANADPCAWISPADAARLLGPLTGTPRRGHDAGNPEATS